MDAYIRIGVSGPVIQYLKTFKKFCLGAELQLLRASPTMSFPHNIRFLEAGQGEGWGSGPEQLGEAHTAFDRVPQIF